MILNTIARGDEGGAGDQARVLGQRGEEVQVINSNMEKIKSCKFKSGWTFLSSQLTLKESKECSRRFLDMLPGIRFTCHKLVLMQLKHTWEYKDVF